MTHRERFLTALDRKPLTGRVPTFELVYFLTMEKIGRVHPSHRSYSQWTQMSARERELQLSDMADCYIEIAKLYDHDALFVHPNPGGFADVKRLLEIIREKTGDEYYIMMHGDPTFSMPDGGDMMDFAVDMLENEQKLLDLSRSRTDSALESARKLAGLGLLDGYALCSDYCFNVNPFFTPEQFSVFVAPDLRRVIEGYHSLGYRVIKHTDGNIMPIIDQIVACGPDALHSLDPQAGVSLKEVKRLYGDRVALCGNVNCGLLQTGTDEECARDVRRSLREGMEGWGYIFCTSNCVYTGLPLERYEMMMDIWRREGNYKTL